ncbi:MAG: type I-E CRISPR-associated protein Cas5/CasD [Alphaproteobacteria bacterium]|nr:type I-E CRISPR-associated protein Cas5/CasD [Alphaproteobacteria bacterium]
MTTFLVFQLFGPLTAWGDIAVGERRAVVERPSRSAVLGLLAGALGIERSDDDAHAELEGGLGLSVLATRSGTPMRDFHTAQVAKARRKQSFDTRRAELSEGDLSTIVSWRDYQTDAAAWVAAVVRDGSALTAERLAAAMERPHYAPFLGRRSCPPALPFAPTVLEAEHAVGAFAAYHQATAKSAIAAVHGPTDAMLYWDEDVPSGLDAERWLVRRDTVVSRRRRQFAERREGVARVPANVFGEVG